MDLDAVESKQHEIGVKWQLMDERLMLTSSVFDITKSGTLITETIQDPNFDTRTTQAGEQSHTGFEIAAQGAVTDKFFVMSSLLNINAEFKNDQNYSGKTPADVPKWAASLWSRYEFNQDFAINAGAFYEGKRFADNANTVEKDGYVRVDVGATYRFDLSGYDASLRFNISNLLDKKYVIGGGLNSVTAADGISFRLAAQIAF